MEKIQITQIELIELLKNVNSFKFVNVVTKTTPSEIRKFSDTKERIPFENIQKITKQNYMFCVDYRKRLENEYKKRGWDTSNLEIQPQKGGIKRTKKNSPLLINEQGEYYLMLEWFPNVKNKKTTYINENGIIDKNELKKFIKYTENKELVKVIKPKLVNIKEISFDGKKYIVI